MRQIELTVANRNNDTDKIMSTQPLKNPLKRLNSLENEAHYVTENGSNGEENSETSVESSESGNSENIDCVSPRSSRSSSLNSTPEVSTSLAINTTKNRVLNGPAYARNLLRKRIMAPEVSSFDYLSADDVRIEDDTRPRILDYKSDAERPSGFRKYSFNDKLKNLVDMSRESNREKAAAMKKLITSPNLLRKSQSFKTTDSISSSAENEHLEKRRKRKISIGKRSRKSSKSQLVEKEHDQKHEKHKPEQRSTKFRRRKLVKSQSESSLFSYDVKKSKLILLYSGDSSIKSEKLVRKNRVDLLKHNKESSMESSSEYDDYSSALSDVEVFHRNLSPNYSNKLKKGRRGFAKRVWKSINSLFLTDDPTGIAKPSPPSICRNPHKTSNKSTSMPGGLNRVKSFSGRKNSLLKSEENLVAKDDLVLLKKNKKKHSREELTLATKLQRIFKFSRENMLDESPTRRSKSLDYLFEYSTAAKDSPAEWFEQRKKAHSTLTPRENNKRMAKNSLQYKVIVSQQPSPNKDGNPPPSSSSSSSNNNKSTTSKTIEKLLKRSTAFDSNTNSSTTNLSKLKKSKSMARRKGLVRVRLQDIKLVCHRELESFLTDKPFEPSEVTDWCRALSESIKDRIVQITEDNYKIVAQVFIGALCDDGIHAAVQCTTQKQNNNDGEESDEGFFTVTFKGKDLFAVASVLHFELQ